MTVTGLVLLLLTLVGMGAIVGYSFWLPRRHPDAFAGFIEPDRHEMRRHMLLGLYCNADDPRPYVPHPWGRGWRGWTLNLRNEHLAVVFMMMGMLAGATALVLLLAVVLY